MSQVKFEKETVTATDGKENIVRNIGEAITKSSGPNGYLAVSIDFGRDFYARNTRFGPAKRTTADMTYNSGT